MTRQGLSPRKVGVVSPDATGSLLGCPVEEQLSLIRRVSHDLNLREAEIKRMAETYPHKDMTAVKLWENATQHARLRSSFKAFHVWVIEKDSRWVCDDVVARCKETEESSFQLHADSVRLFGRGRPLPPSGKEKEKTPQPLISIGSPTSPLILIGAGALIAILIARR